MRYYVRPAKDRDGYYVTDRKDGENYAYRKLKKDAEDLCAKKNKYK